MTAPQDERTGFVCARGAADVAVVVVTYNSVSDIPPLIDDLRIAARDRPMRVIVVDNHSSDGTAEVVRAHQDILLIESGGNLGYAGGINTALPYVDPCEAVLVLNPDLRLGADAITRLRGALDADARIGAVVPLILEGDGRIHPSLGREPSLTRAVGDAVLGSRLWRSRPGILSEFDYRPSSYVDAHDVDWATGAALLIRGSLVREVGGWDERYFLYSEETDYCRRLRECGHSVRFEPSAVVTHRMGGSGTSPPLHALLAVNRVRYVEVYHRWVFSALFRLVVAMAEALRSYDPVHRRAFAVVANRSRWRELPRATRPPAVERIPGPRRRGAVIVPAYNEAMVIERTLAPLSGAAVAGFIELIVVCNGCTDTTAAVARRVPGVRVVEVEPGSKPLALNTGDAVASLWPRLYLDADIEVTATAVIEVLDRLDHGDVLAARPAFRYDSDGASILVRSYYRARRRVAPYQHTLWSASVYGLSVSGHERFGAFPDVTGDDLFIDTRFDDHEKTVVETEPTVWRTPSDTRSLVAILRRHHRGNRELLAVDPDRTHSTASATVRDLLRTVRGPGSAADAAVYIGMALAARRPRGKANATWERDESSRSNR